MKRVDVIYGGIRYSIPSRDPDALKAEIAEALTSGAPYWLAVNHGEGTLQKADLLITPGVDLSVMGLDPGVQDDRSEGDVALPGELIS